MYINQNISLRQGGRKVHKGGKDKLKRFLNEDELDEWISDGNSAQFLKDCEKIDFSFENVMPATMHTTDSGVDFLSFLAGGDWEIPLLVILYWDGKKYRGYIPIKGNVINLKTKSAFGNYDEEDEEYIKEYYGKEIEMDEIEPDINSCFEDFEQRVEVINDIPIKINKILQLIKSSEWIDDDYDNWCYDDNYNETDWTTVKRVLDEKEGGDLNYVPAYVDVNKTLKTNEFKIQITDVEYNNEDWTIYRMIDNNDKLLCYILTVD